MSDDRIFIARNEDDDAVKVSNNGFDNDNVRDEYSSNEINNPYYNSHNNRSADDRVRIDDGVRIGGDDSRMSSDEIRISGDGSRIAGGDSRISGDEIRIGERTDDEIRTANDNNTSGDEIRTSW